MQKRKFDELISHFNRKVSDMSIDQKYKMELLGMISAIGFVHENELSTNLASLGTDCISRQQAIDLWEKYHPTIAVDAMQYDAELRQLPPIQPKRGRWLYSEDTTADSVDGYRCDQCGLFVPWDYTHKSIDYIKDYNFCPNCGAMMEGE